MYDINEKLPTDKSEPMKKTDWLLVIALVFLLLLTFPVLWRIYRFIIPLAVFALVIYFMVRLMQPGKIGSPDSETTSRNFMEVWNEVRISIRSSFRSLALTI